MEGLILWSYLFIHYQPSLKFSLSNSICGSTALFGPWPLFQFRNLFYTVGRTPWTGISPSQGLYTHRTTQTQNKRTQTFMPRMGFEPTIPVFERANTVHALERAATVIGSFPKYCDMSTLCWMTTELLGTGR
jgi:hypothetical protein